VNKEIRKSKNTVIFAPGESDILEPKTIGKNEVSATTSKAIFGLRNIGNTCKISLSQ